MHNQPLLGQIAIPDSHPLPVPGWCQWAGGLKGIRALTIKFLRKAKDHFYET
ncbi:hypothetical protein EBL_c22360 [Shimwellia blattae DSM 4481 = NBRC 105725]|uniref:Uncharacterized protein n=1 Tax=Shimwellia blattae (strain ATCC 29907 / DSM 4481 / JCM 1650 / NBRC 105725 / CDC 9005-74) TaxID=630626 RepID=I2B9X3_SHIBC|nr:hypothetical protein EBL_c22360 [Shimwellia blattae DSM 4481 = NBRC 105725]